MGERRVFYSCHPGHCSLSISVGIIGLGVCEWVDDLIGLEWTVIVSGLEGD
jgi:hypothetical protein